MAIEERGLLHTLELECWVNGSVPADHRELGRVLSLDVAEIEKGLSDRVWRYLELNQEQGTITCPELEAYRQALEARRAGMSTGGKKGADTRWKDKVPNSHPIEVPIARLRGDEPKGEEPKGEERKGAAFKTKDISSEQSEWVQDYVRGSRP